MNNNEQKQIKEAIDFLNKNDNFLIVSHVHPDGDTISSSLAMAQILKKLNKSFVLVNQDTPPEKFNYLPMLHEIKSIADVNRQFDYVITVDVADRSRAGEIDRLLSDKALILNIDHHPTNDMFGNVNLIQANAASTTEVVYDLVKEMDLKLDNDIAACIYTGLLTDTGGFRYSNTTPKVMRIAAELLEYGVSPGKIAEVALETITKGHISLLKVALDNLEVLEDGFVSWTEMTHEDLQLGSNDDDSEGIVNYTRNIEGVEVGVFFKEVKPGEVKVSLRSKKLIDVGSIAKEFGGGGHARASGYTYHGSLTSAKEDLLKKITEAKGEIT